MTLADRKRKQKTSSAVTYKKILITGASGFIGRAAVKHFLEAGYNVRAFVRRKKGILQTHKNLEIVEGDIRRENDVLQSVKGCDAVIHLAAAKSDEPESYATNILGAKNLIAACRAQNVQRIINVSTASVKLRTKGAYGATKLAADTLFMKSGLAVTTLRASIIYGNMQEAVFGSLTRFAALPVTPVIGNGRCVFRPLYLEDFLFMLEKTLNTKKTEGRIYDVGGTESISLNLLVQRIAKEILQKENVRIVHIPVSIGMVIAFFARICMKHPPLTRSNILGSTQSVHLDVVPYFKDIELVPHSLTEGLRAVAMQEYTPELEARTLFSYVLSPMHQKKEITKEEIKRYLRACTDRGIPLVSLTPQVLDSQKKLGALDAISRLKYPHGMLQKKLYIAATLVECHPRSAPWLLPRQSSLLTLIAESVCDVFNLGIKLAYGLFLLITSPRFVKKNVG